MDDAIDSMVVGLSHDGDVRLRAVRSTQTVEEARVRLGTSPTATVALGQLLTFGLMFGSDLQDQQSLTITIKGDNPDTKLVVVVEDDHTIRGTINNPSADVPMKDGQYDIPAFIGLPGYLSVVKDLRLKEPYVGLVPLQVGWIAKDLSFYLLTSEQKPSAVSLGVQLDAKGRVVRAAGYLIQLMPGAEDSGTAVEIESRIAMTPSMTELLSYGDSPTNVLELLMGGEIDILASYPVKYQCRCTRERFKAGLLTLGLDELRKLEAEDPSLTLSCQFCTATYQIGPEELAELIEEAARQ